MSREDRQDRREARQSRRAARRTRRETEGSALLKNSFELIGLKWSNNPEVRAAAFQAGFDAVSAANLLDEDAKKDFKKLLAAMSTGQILAGVRPALSVMQTRDDILRVFGLVWNEVITGGPPADGPAEVAPRKQIDFGEVGGALPPQSVAMVTPQKSTMPTWVLPALGLAAVAYVWSSRK